MRTASEVRLATVGELLKELKAYDGECLEYYPTVSVSGEDDREFCIVATGLDEDGDLQIGLGEMDMSEGYYNVQELIDDLEGYDGKTRMYLAGCGLYLAFEQEGGVFCAPEDDTVGSYATVIGDYEEEPRGGMTEKERRRAAGRSAWKARTKDWKGILECATFLLCIPLTVYGLYYNIAALVKHSRPAWESVLWIPFLALLLWVCIDNLFFPDRNE